MGLYESVRMVIADMTRKENTNNLQIGGPIWPLHLCLNATFEPSLKIGVPLNPKVGVKGPRLAKLTPNDGKVVSKETFENYFLMFYMCKTFIEMMEAFSSR